MSTVPIRSLWWSSLPILQDAVTQWADATFPGATADRTFAHLEREVVELGTAIQEGVRDGESGIGAKMADVVILLCHLASKCDVDLATAIALKWAIVQRRQYGPPDAEGVREHRREASQ